MQYNTSNVLFGEVRMWYILFIDALQGKEWAMEEEQQRLNELHEKDGIPRRFEEILDFDSLKGKRVAVLFNDKENDNKDKGKCVKMWYFGKVNRIKKKRDMNEGCKAVIEWEAGGNETEQTLYKDMWAGPGLALHLNSWMPA